MTQRFLAILLLAFVMLPSHLLADGPQLIKAADYPEGGSLKISAADAVLLDIRGADFSAAQGSGFGPPDTIALQYIGDQIRGYYSLPYASEKPVVRLDATSLTPRGNPAFPGFEPGATAFLMIGREVPEGSLDMGVFADQWNLYITVNH